MSKEAMKLALEVLEGWKEYMPAVWEQDDEKAITALREALTEQPAQQEQDRQIDQLIQERDHRDEIIDKLCDAVLGPDRYEWSSQYFFEDAVREVQERIAALEKPAQQEPVAWSDEQLQMLNFLYGAGEFDGVWFDEKHPTEKAAFWWRKHLRRLFDTHPQAREPEQPAQRTWAGLTDAEKDATRWRFLVDNSFDKDGVTQFHVWEHSWEPHSQTGEPTEWKQRVRGPALDRFIDRAIEAAHNIFGDKNG